MVSIPNKRKNEGILSNLKLPDLSSHNQTKEGAIDYVFKVASQAQPFLESALSDVIGDKKRRSDYAGSHNYPANRKSRK